MIKFETVRIGDKRCVRCPSCGTHPGKTLVDPLAMLTWLFHHWRINPNCR